MLNQNLAPEPSNNRLYYGDKELTPEELAVILADLDRSEEEEDV